MSFKVEGSCCQRCHAKLFSEDDVVYCPVCGAPHHRECYNRLGHCALEELHGTDRQYSKESQAEAEEAVATAEPVITDGSNGMNVCRMCGERYSKSLGRCPKCSAPDFSKISGYTEFDFLGGVPADYKLAENVTADDAKRFVAANPQRYIPKFAVLTEKNKLSWNWMAFFFPCGWMLARKMYKGGIAVGFLSVILSLFSYPLTVAINNLGLAETADYAELTAQIYERLPEIGIPVLLFAFLGLGLSLALRIICGLFSDYFYKKHTVSTVTAIKAESSDISYDFRKKGGVNVFLFLLGTMAVNYAPIIITAFL